MISVVIPARDIGAAIRLLLQSIQDSSVRPGEVILVDDQSADSLEPVAQSHGAKYLRTPRPMGPAAARNLGARHSNGDILLFLDADVTVHADTIQRLATALESDPALSAVIGSYDDAPGHTGFWSRYRNLLHAWMHQTASPTASTFWGACGAIRREAFDAVDGFPEVYSRPAIEDIELGCNLVKAGFRIRLDRHALVCHHKAWSFWRMLRTDVFDRAVPWTLLILRERQMPNDLNLRRGQRVNACLAAILLFVAPAMLLGPPFPALWAIVLAFYLARNARLYRFFLRSQGSWFTLRAALAHWLYYLSGCLGFALGAACHLKASVPFRARESAETARASRP